MSTTKPYTLAGYAADRAHGDLDQDAMRATVEALDAAKKRIAELEARHAAELHEVAQRAYLAGSRAEKERRGALPALNVAELITKVQASILKKSDDRLLAAFDSGALVVKEKP